MKKNYIFSWHNFPNPEVLQFEQKWKFEIKCIGITNSPVMEMIFSSHYLCMLELQSIPT